MSTIRLEFEKLEILRKKRKWKLYIIIVAEHPTESDKMVLTTIPAAGENFFRLKRNSENVVDFEPQSTDSGVDGLFVLEREMPVDRTVRVRAFLKHSRKSTRGIGDIFKEIEGGLGSNVLGTVTNILGSSSPWLMIAKTAISLVGEVLSKINDRDFGYLSMDEEFGPEFEGKRELDRTNTFTTGDAKLRWSWRVKD